MGANLTSWQRLEATASQTDIEEGLQARIADPLWMLARQWQTGEFQGEDAAMPVFARVVLERLKLDRMRVHGIDDDRVGFSPTENPIVRPLADAPLEALIEGEVLSGAGLTARSLEAGAQLLERVNSLVLDAGRPDVVATVRKALRGKYPFLLEDEKLESDLAPASSRLLKVLRGRALDGDLIRREIRTLGATSIAAGMGFGAALEGLTVGVLNSWAEWYDSRFREPVEETDTAWKRERMEYSFAVAAQDGDQEVVLKADEFHGGHLDWSAFDVSAETSLDGKARTGAEQGREVELNLMPAAMRYRGMPADRFWEVEDRRVHFAKFSSAPGEVAKSLLAEFSMAYSDDWFRVPVRLAAGDLVRVGTLEIFDNFLGATVVEPTTAIDGPNSAWRLFVMDGDPALEEEKSVESSAFASREVDENSPFRIGSTGFTPDESLLTALSGAPQSKPGPWLLRAPSLARGLESEAIEEVVFARDEMANMGWAVERTVESRAGVPLSRAQQWSAKRRLGAVAAEEESGEATSTASGESAPKYQIQSSVPDYWIPMVPLSYETHSTAEQGAIIFRRGKSIMPDGSDMPEPMGRILEPERKLLVFEEELPSSGITISRHWQLARWHDGSTWLWLSRRKRRGLGEQSSGLVYDRVED